MNLAQVELAETQSRLHEAQEATKKAQYEALTPVSRQKSTEYKAPISQTIKLTAYISCNAIHPKELLSAHSMATALADDLSGQVRSLQKDLAGVRREAAASKQAAVAAQEESRQELDELRRENEVGTTHRCGGGGNST